MKGVIVQRGDVDGEVKGDGRAEAEAKTTERGGTRPGRKNRDTSEEAKREGRTREWRGRCGTKQDKREVCLQSDRRLALGWEVKGCGQNQKRIIMILSKCFLKDVVLLCGED